MRLGVYQELKQAMYRSNNSCRPREAEVYAFSHSKNTTKTQRKSEDAHTLNESQWSYFGIMMVMMIDDEKKQITNTQQTQARM
jgi:hypothetical protein